MTDSPTDSPGLGHNQPPIDAPFDERKARCAELIASANEWLTSVVAIDTAGQAERATDLLTVIRVAQQENDSFRKASTAPARQQIDEINSQYKMLAAPLDKSAELLKGLLLPWVTALDAKRIARAKAEREDAERAYKRAEDQRLKAQSIEDQVAADEAAAQAEKLADQAAATARSRAQVRGEVSPRATALRSVWKATAITDPALAIGQYGEHPDLLDLLLRLASADARAGRRRIPGFKVEKISSVA